MKTITCTGARPHLLDYAEGELDEALRTALREHLSACQDCRRELEETESLRSALGAARVPDPGRTFWNGFPDRVWQAYRAEASVASRATDPRIDLNSLARWWSGLSLRLRFNLALLAVFCPGLAITGYLSYEVLERNARAEVVRNAGLILEAAMSMRSYTTRQISPLLSRDPGTFHPQTVPAYAATEMMTQLRKTYSDYSYKDAVLNPINPRNRAAGWETEVVDSFRSNTAQAQVSGVRDTAEGPLFYVARPSQVVSEACLACHTTPEQAPPAMVKIYGTSSGYGWKYKEIVGAHIVSVPMALPIRNANRAFLVFMASFTAVFAVLLIVLNLMLNAMILPPGRVSSDTPSRPGSSGA